MIIQAYYGIVTVSILTWEWCVLSQIVTNTSTGNTTTSDTSTTSDANTSSGTSTTSVASSSSSYSIDVTATNSSNYTLSGSDRSGNISGNDPDLIFNVGDTIDFVVKGFK